MEIYTDTKINVTKSFVELLETKNLHKKENIKSLCYLFAKYCLSDLGLEGLDIVFLKDVKGRFGSYAENKIYLNSRYLGRNLPIVLNTIAHEIKHHHQSTLVNHKKLNEKSDVIFPIKHFNSHISFVIYDENNLFNPVYFTSQNEKEAREYALQITEKFLTDVKLHNCAFSTSWANSVLKKNDEFKKIEQKKYAENLEKSNKTKKTLKNITKYTIIALIKFSLGDASSLQNNHIEYYANLTKSIDGSLASIYAMLFDYENSDEVVQKVFDTSIKLKDVKTLNVLINHQNIHLSENEILKSLFIILDKKPLSFNDAQKLYLYSYDSSDSKYLTKKYNEELLKYLKDKKLQKNIDFDKNDKKNDENSSFFK